VFSPTSVDARGTEPSLRSQEGSVWDGGSSSGAGRAGCRYVLYQRRSAAIRLVINGGSYNYRRGRWTGERSSTTNTGPGASAARPVGRRALRSASLRLRPVRSRLVGMSRALQCKTEPASRNGSCSGDLLRTTRLSPPARSVRRFGASGKPLSLRCRYPVLNAEWLRGGLPRAFGSPRRVACWSYRGAFPVQPLDVTPSIPDRLPLGDTQPDTGPGRCHQDAGIVGTTSRTHN
jgi:hypothetical protein